MLHLSCRYQEAEEKVKLEELAANAAANKAGKKGAQTPRPVDTDPDGDKLMNVCLFFPCICVRAEASYLNPAIFFFGLYF